MGTESQVSTGKPSTVIHLSGVTKSYRVGDSDVHALCGIELSIRRGEYIAIMGPSGSGKSTLMHILGCLDRPTLGTYELSGNRVDQLGDNELSATRNREIGFIFQSFNLLSSMSVLQNIELPMVYANASARVMKERAVEAIRRVGLLDRMAHLPNELSGGQRQRVAIARALVNQPAILLADEPTGNLDSKTGAEIMVLFAELHAQGNTVVLVTHDSQVARHADRIIHIKDGLVQREELVAAPVGRR